MDWFSRLPLAGQRLVVPDEAEVVARRLETAGAEIVPVPFPVTPAARVVMAALPVTGCVVTSAAEVDWIHEERGGPGWVDEAPSWCVGHMAAARARERGWRPVYELKTNMDCNELVAGIADRLR